MNSIESLTTAIAQEQKRFTEYHTFEELREEAWRLHEEYPELVRIETIGNSSDRSTAYPNGRPIEAMIISTAGADESKRPYALKQLEHENELPAAEGLQLTAEVVCKNPDILDDSGYNLILINKTHPDGIALQRWVAEGDGQFDSLLYASWFFRSRAQEQIGWGYPFQYKNANFTTPVPEVQASMHVMQKYKPTFLHAVHAAGIDDPHFYISYPNQEFIAELEGVVANNDLVMQQGESELPYMTAMKPGIFSPLPSARATYDYREKYTSPKRMQWSHGCTSIDYLSGIVEKPFGFLSEVPYLTADALHETGQSGLTRREAAKICMDQELEILGEVASCFKVIESAANQNESVEVGRLVRSIRWWCRDFTPARVVGEKKALESSDFDGDVTSATAFGIIQRRNYYSMLYLGEVHFLARILGRHCLADDIQGKIKSKIEDIEAASPLKVTSLPNLVGIQALSGLIAMQHGSHFTQRKRLQRIQT